MPIVAYPLIYFYIQIIPIYSGWGKFSGLFSSVLFIFFFVIFPVVVLNTIAKQVMQEEHITLKSVVQWAIPLILFFLIFQGANLEIRSSHGCGGAVGCLGPLWIVLGLLFIAALMNIIYKRSKHTK